MARFAPPTRGLNSASAETFGEGVITVEFDDGDRDADAYVLDEGDRVIVYGLIDHDLFEGREVVAESGVTLED